jgi:hypothetical protein
MTIACSNYELGYYIKSHPSYDPTTDNTLYDWARQEITTAYAQAALDRGDYAAAERFFAGRYSGEQAALDAATTAASVFIISRGASLPMRPGGKGPTTGEFFASGDYDGVTIRSGRGNGYSANPADYGLPVELNTRGKPNLYYVQDHVEAKAALRMRQNSIMDADLVVNNAPCTGPASCDKLLPQMLPKDATLRVHIFESGAFVETRTYRGQ